jgi:hypothetical protein
MKLAVHRLVFMSDTIVMLYVMTSLCGYKTSNEVFEPAKAGFCERVVLKTN